MLTSWLLFVVVLFSVFILLVSVALSFLKCMHSFLVLNHRNVLSLSQLEIKKIRVKIQFHIERKFGNVRMRMRFFLTPTKLNYKKFLNCCCFFRSHYKFTLFYIGKFFPHFLMSSFVWNKNIPHNEENSHNPNYYYYLFHVLSILNRFLTHSVRTFLLLFPIWLTEHLV